MQKFESKYACKMRLIFERILKIAKFWGPLRWPPAAEGSAPKSQQLPETTAKKLFKIFTTLTAIISQSILSIFNDPLSL